MPETIRTPVFTRYELLEEIGSGGMGAVYKARQKYVGRLVAFKVLPPALRNDTEALQRFEREAAALGRLKHPNVVGVFDAGVEGGFPYLAMEFVEGKNLRQVLQERGRLSVEAVVRLGLEMADALDHIERQGLVHRDVKPSNIILDPDGKAMLTDFGIAFAATLPRITQGTMGTPEFMSPEQADGQTLDIRSDLYSLGVVLYECLTGAVPFQRKGDSLTSLSHLLNQVLREKPPRLQDRRPDAPAWLAEAVHRCMEKNPQDRFQTGAALVEVLRTNTGQEAAAPPAVLPPEAPPEQPPTPESPPVEQESPPEKNETPPPAPQPERPRPAARKTPAQEPARETAPQGWTGSFVYRSNTNPVEIPDAPPASLPVPVQKPEKPTEEAKQPPAKQASKKVKKPRARTAAKIWFVIGLVTFLSFIIQNGLPSLGFGVIAFNILCLTPTLTGALVTLFSRSKKKKSKVVRGILLGAIFGLVLSLALTGAFMAVTFGPAFDVSILGEEVVRQIIAASA
ncbi:MAG: serine/threonine protein kinase, partial [Bacteroidetes bacterium]|nr:serine/threonine protein kinase [Bacteroidota bacterium]